MIKTQLWEPDTHPGVQLHTEWDTDNPQADHVCIAAFIGGAEQADPEGVYLTVLAENRLKNQALTIICDTLPQAMKKPVLDSDGDETGEWVVKDKHTPAWDFGAVDGRVSFTVPGADPATLQAIREALAGFGDAVIVG